MLLLLLCLLLLSLNLLVLLLLLLLLSLLHRSHLPEILLLLHGSEESVRLDVFGISFGNILSLHALEFL